MLRLVLSGVITTITTNIVSPPSSSPLAPRRHSTDTTDVIITAGTVTTISIDITRAVDATIVNNPNPAIRRATATSAHTFTHSESRMNFVYHKARADLLRIHRRNIARLGAYCRRQVNRAKHIWRKKVLKYNSMAFITMTPWPLPCVAPFVCSSLATVIRPTPLTAPVSATRLTLRKSAKFIGFVACSPTMS
jgi:hypothetical protein